MSKTTDGQFETVIHHNGEIYVPQSLALQRIADAVKAERKACVDLLRDCSYSQDSEENGAFMRAASLIENRGNP